jgi:hypothetical protein
MQYSYESWAAVPSTLEKEKPDTSLSEDVYALEESLTMNWDEVIAAQHSKELPESTSQAEQSLQIQLEKLWQIADTHYQDNRALAAQVQSLLNERTQMQSMLHAYELEVSRYRQLLGNLYLKH